MFDSFHARRVDLGTHEMHLRLGGAGAPLLLLHGFPESHLMWRDIAPLLASHFTVICPDMHGYGESGFPASTPDHAPYTKRAMGADFVALMRALGHEQFSVAGHDRGGRVAYRMALDHPGQIDRLALLDIVSTLAAWDRADDRFALSFWPWSLLAQPHPMPEHLISAAPQAIIDHVRTGWGAAAAFPEGIADQYARTLADFDRAHAICEEYRAAAGIDREHDRIDMGTGRRRITCPTLVLWSADGGLNSWYTDVGGPLALWREFCLDLQGYPVSGGHFFPEEFPEDTAAALLHFFA